MIKIGKYGLSIQSPEGSMPAGRNGPHGHNMTPVRNTGHWSVLYSYLFQQTKEQSWSDAARKSIDLIISDKYHPLKGAFWERQEPHRSSTNGLIGQAWTIEAIQYAATTLNVTRYMEKAQKVVNHHKFDSNIGLWHEIDLAGYPQEIGMTLNQQIWFMSQALTIIPEREMVNQANLFLDYLPKNSKIRKTGLFYTGINCSTSGKFQNIRKIKRKIMQSVKEDDRLEIDNGYHIFTLLGLTMLYKKLPKHPYFKSEDFLKALTYAFSDTHHHSLEHNKFAYPYNVPGLELPVIWHAFEDVLPDNSLDVTRSAYNKQIIQYESYIKNPCATNYDSETWMARFYEITRFGKELINRMDK
jgi:hypothetical protein